MKGIKVLGSGKELNFSQWREELLEVIFLVL
jgi:hypothetical protein